MDSINQLLYDINNKCSDYFFGIHSISLSNYREYVLDMNGENFNWDKYSDKVSEYKYVFTLDELGKYRFNYIERIK